MLFGTSNFDRQGIINNTVAFGKAARVFDVPVVLTTVETKSFSGNMWPQLRAVFPGQEPIERSSMNSWDDKNFVAAIEKTGRKKILIAGLWTETRPPFSFHLENLKGRLPCLLNSFCTTRRSPRTECRHLSKASP